MKSPEAMLSVFFHKNRIIKQCGYPHGTEEMRFPQRCRSQLRGADVYVSHVEGGINTSDLFRPLKCLLKGLVFVLLQFEIIMAPHN